MCSVGCWRLVGSVLRLLEEGVCGYVSIEAYKVSKACVCGCEGCSVCSAAVCGCVGSL